MRVILRGTTKQHFCTSMISIIIFVCKNNLLLILCQYFEVSTTNKDIMNKTMYGMWGSSEELKNEHANCLMFGF